MSYVPLRAQCVNALLLDAQNTKDAAGHQTEKQTSRQRGNGLSLGSLFMSHPLTHGYRVNLDRTRPVMEVAT